MTSAMTKIQTQGDHHLTHAIAPMTAHRNSSLAHAE